MAKYTAAQLGICNAALRHLANKAIKSITEASEPAAACLGFYDQTRDEVLREFRWPFATRFAALTLVGGTATLPVTLEWRYSYRLPDDCLAPRRILSGTRQETEDTRIPFDTASDATGGLLYADVPPVVATDTTPQLPQLEYTVVVAEARFPADFAQAFALKLAFYIAPAVTGGDPNKLGQRAGQLYEMLLARSEFSAMTERQRDPAPESEFIRSRY
jgi:hypothetical protein